MRKAIAATILVVAAILMAKDITAIETVTLVPSANYAGNQQKYNRFVEAQRTGQLDELNVKSNSFVVPNVVADEIIIVMAIDPTDINKTEKAALQFDYMLPDGTWQPSRGFTTEGPWTEGVPTLSFGAAKFAGKTVRVRAAMTGNLRYAITATW